MYIQMRIAIMQNKVNDHLLVENMTAQEERYYVSCLKSNASGRENKDRKQKFSQKWLFQPEFSTWLTYDENDEYRAKCIYCSYSMTSQLLVIRRHGQSVRHKEKMKAAIVKQKSILNFISEKQSVDKTIMSTEIKLVGFLAEHNLPFRLADHLVHLLKDICHDHPVVKNIAMESTKATNIAVNVIGAYHKEKLAQILKKTKFSLLTAESTDISCVKTSCVVVRFNDIGSKKIVSEFWELSKIFDSGNPNEGATAENLFKGIIKSLENNSIPLSNLIGFAADGCSTMMGKHNSVASRFKENCPDIFILKCVCHSAHLCANEACKNLPSSVEYLAKDIYQFFQSISKRQSQLQEFQEFQEFVNVTPHKMLHPSQTRWLSLIMVVERVIERWEALKLYFTNGWLIERLEDTEQIFEELNKPITKLYFFFLEWILPKFTDFNCFFQTNAAVITELHDRIVNLYKEILLCYMNKDYIMKTSLSDINPCKQDEFIPYAQMYLGIKVLQIINNGLIQQKDLKDFFWRCRKFLQVSAQQISNRYMQDPVLSQLGALRPKNALSLAYRDNTPTLINLMKVVPRILDCQNNNDVMQVIDDQWRRLPISGYLLPKDIGETNICADKFWNQILDCNNGTEKSEFHELATFALGVLSLPHSNADCERICSKINMMKTKYSNELEIETINGLLLAAECVKQSGERNCITFQPTNEMLNKMKSTVLYSQKNEKQPISENSNVEIIF